MSFPANAIGLAAGVGAGAYAGYHQGQAGPWTAIDFIVIAVLLAIALFFSLILS